jgi:hypothetical protein
MWQQQPQLEPEPAPEPEHEPTRAVQLCSKPSVKMAGQGIAIFIRSSERRQAVRESGYALRHAAAHLRVRGDREIVLEAVRQSGWALHFAAEYLRVRGDREIVEICGRAKTDPFCTRCAARTVRRAD